MSINPLLAQMDVQLMDGQLANILPHHRNTRQSPVLCYKKQRSNSLRDLHFMQDRKPKDSSVILLTVGTTAVTAGTEKGFAVDTLAHTFTERTCAKDRASRDRFHSPAFQSIEETSNDPYLPLFLN